VEYSSASEFWPEINSGTFSTRRGFPERKGGSGVHKQAPPDGYRLGAVKDRTQLQTKIQGEEHWTKRDKTTGQFMDQKTDEEKFKGVRKE
jgi:hypothetical protein